MKTLAYILLILAIANTLAAKKKKVERILSKRKEKKVAPSECDLTMETFPLYYIPIVRASAFRLGFSSACLPKTTINFEIYHDDNKHINIYHHPTQVNLNLWGNKYTIKYEKAFIIDKHDIMKSLEYRAALLNPFINFKTGIKINTMAQNDIFLDPQIKNTFNPYTIKKLENTKGLVKCTIKDVKVKGWKKLKAEADRRKNAEKAKAAKELAEQKKIREEEKLRLEKLNKAEGRKLTKKTKEQTLPDEYYSQKDKIKALMKKKWIVDYHINCEIK